LEWIVILLGQDGNMIIGFQKNTSGWYKLLGHLSLVTIFEIIKYSNL